MKLQLDPATPALPLRRVSLKFTLLRLLSVASNPPGNSVYKQISDATGSANVKIRVEYCVALLVALLDLFHRYAYQKSDPLHASFYTEPRQLRACYAG